MITEGITDLPDYCRQIESYLCRKNGGHLIRIVGPAFELVRSWADQGVPLKVAFQGIDRCVERSIARAGRRRPLRIEFCEADVVEAFDAWRRAIGVVSRAPEEATSSEEGGSAGRKGSLAAHIARSLSRLLVVKAEPDSPDFSAVITRVTSELDRLAETARSARGEARARSIARLAELDAELIGAARASVKASAVAVLQREADAELSSFAGRMATDSLEKARALTFERLLRDSLNLPVLSYD